MNYQVFQRGTALFAGSPRGTGVAVCSPAAGYLQSTCETRVKLTIFKDKEDKEDKEDKADATSSPLLGVAGGNL